MNKLKLSLDELQVTSFATATAERDARGTVLGNSIMQHTDQPNCEPFSGPCTGPQCDYTLMISCAGNCGPTSPDECVG